MPLSILSHLRKSKSPPASVSSITIVSGLPRSGTSMMMKVLENGGMQIQTDQVRTADVDNPKGYYEYERVKKLKDGNTGWVSEVNGKVVKVVSPLLQYLPAEHSYKIIFMHRNVDEILASQKRMMSNRDEATDRISDEEMAQIFIKHLTEIEVWLSQQEYIEVLYIDYNHIIHHPDHDLKRINQFLDGKLAVDRMAEAIDVDLYRQRSNR